MVSALECDHCGGDACTSDARGLFHEGMADRCETCGFPGRVVIDGHDDDPDENTPSWCISARLDARCTQLGCEECPA